MSINVTEIMSSLQGEGKYAGYPTTFIRLHGCNLNCTFCDTKYANEGKKRKMSVSKILSEVFAKGNDYVCITGGEPLLQDEIFEVIYELVPKGYRITIETNGAVPIDMDFRLRPFSYCMDIKCPSSGMDEFNIYANLSRLQSQDEVKFVVKDINDYQFARNILKRYNTKAGVIFSPVMGDEENIADLLAHWIEEDKIPKARLGVQLHKLVGFY